MKKEYLCNCFLSMYLFMYKASLIISIYKNIVFLKAVLDSLSFQTEKNFEIIISEDGCSPDVEKFIKSYPFKNDYQHLTQEDIGWRKNIALNRAIIAARAEHLIFIDGDCILHPRFIEMHVRFSQKGRILAGKRAMLGEKQSKILLDDPSKVVNIQPKIWGALIGMYDISRPEEGIFISPIIPVYKFRKLEYLTGCNMSFTKSDIISINGFDEDYTKPAYGEDTDLVWRFKMAGKEFFSLRNLAVQYHINHPKSWTDQSDNMKMGLEKQSRKEYVCLNGINNHIK